MTMRWRITANCSGVDEVVLTENRPAAELISAGFADRGCTDIAIKELPPKPPAP
ncbi:hypothetical protein [Tsuneonella amylolytica]|uniref:hypothetical protein n=1 Tax=Tsuneonella amylolytica TaxID=2338327 RepID=UPI0013C533EA|nr:hypothetical protein [Tsuneonella amylolytica]